LIWHQEYATDHPIIDVERLLTAVLIRHQSLGTLVLAVIDRGKFCVQTNIRTDIRIDSQTCSQRDSLRWIDSGFGQGLFVKRQTCIEQTD
jgi:hypothetical protein